MKNFHQNLTNKTITSKNGDGIEPGTRKHNVQRLYCNLCDFSATRKDVLRAHIFKHSRFNRIFTCDTCTFKSFEKLQFIEHLKSHTVEKAFKCSLCPYQCNIRLNLSKHYTAVHKDEKSFSCNVCDYTSAHKERLMMHLETHPPWSCLICNYQCMGYKTELMLHMKKFHEPKPFSCALCDYRANVEQKVLAHIGKCHGEGHFFYCSICGFKFAKQRYLEKHFKKHDADTL